MARESAPRRRRFLGPRHWASLRPNGIGLTKPNHYLDMAKVVWQNRDQLPFARRILRDGCCDGCALGTTGLRDWTLDGVHLCTVRLNLLRLNTMPAADHRLLGDPAALATKSSRELRELGRLPYPMAWRAGEPGFRRVSWKEALALAGERLRAVRERDPDRLSIYLTSRGIPNEVYYAAQKAARFLGTNNVDNSARLCHAPSTVGLTQSIGYGATTCSYSDWIGTGLLVLVGSNLANNQPVATKYIHLAKQAGTRVVVVNPYREEGLERYWVPSTVESALFGTKLMDEHFPVQVGGDAAFFTGALKHLLETGRVDRDFVEGHTAGFEELAAHVEELGWPELEEGAGLPAAEIRRFAEMYADAGSSITIWSMGVTQHAHGTQNVLAIANLALALGRVGRPRTGLSPIRGHSGVQGGAEMGAVPGSLGMGRAVADPAAREELARIWGFDPPTRPGLSASASIEAMHEGRIDALYSVGGDFLETLPDPGYVREALERVPVRIFQDIVVNPMMLLPPGELTLLLPGATRYETPGGVTETSTERRVIYSPEIPGRRVGEARPEWEIPLAIARAADPGRAPLLDVAGTAELRAEIARVVPAYAGIERLAAKGDSFQWGGERLCEDGEFGTPDGRARFVAPELPRLSMPPGHFRVSTRRGRQFNSMVQADRDPLTGARREDVFMSRADAGRLGVAHGAPVLLRSPHGEYRGRARVGDCQRPGTLQVHWPEGNALLDRTRVDPNSGEPDYNSVCELIATAGEKGSD